MEAVNYQQIDLSAWKQVGEGGNGKTYVSDAEPGVILKVNAARLSTEQAVKPSFLEKLFFRMHVTGLMKRYYR